MQIIAHRCYSAKYPQNTITAFEHALKLNCSAIELDVHQVENEFVVFHDFNVKKLTGISARIDQLSLSEVRNLRVLNQHKVPLLSEVLELIGSEIQVNIEIKSLNSAYTFATYLSELLAKHNNKVILSSFNHPLLMECKKHLLNQTSIQYGALIAHLPNDLAQYALALGADIAAIDCELVSSDFVQDAHKHDLKVWSYTVNDAYTLENLLDMGVDAIFSDDPEWALHSVEAFSIK